MPQHLLNRSTHPLYILFEKLAQTFLANQTAVWHVPDPTKFSLPSTSPLASDVNTICSSSRSSSSSFSSSSAAYTSLLSDLISSNVVHSITFAQLNQASNQIAINLAHYLRTSTKVEEQCQSETSVALFMPPGIDRIVAQIACMKLHLAYLPLDRNVPAGRTIQILSYLKPVLIIFAEDYYKQLFCEQINEKNHNYRISSESKQFKHHPYYLNNSNLQCQLKQRTSTSNYNNFMAGNLSDLQNHLLNYDVKLYEDIQSMTFNSAEQQCISIPYDICLFPTIINPVILILFTSGSTKCGPKIVRLKLNQLMNRLKWQWDPENDMNLPNFILQKLHVYSHRKTINRRGLAKTSWVFIDGFTELFSCLFSGTPVVIPGGSLYPSEKSVTDVQHLINLIKLFQITHITTVPAQLDLWLKQLRFKLIDNQIHDNLSSLKTVNVSGDILHPKTACEFFQIFNSIDLDVSLINLYGTTEVAGDIACMVFHNEQDVLNQIKIIPYKLEIENPDSGRPILSVGKPIPNTLVLIIENDDNDDYYNFNQINQTMKCIHSSSLSSSSTTSSSSSSTTSVTTTTSAAVCSSTDLSLLSIIGSINHSVDWKQEYNLKILPKGMIGHVCVIGLPVCDIITYNDNNNNNITSNNNNNIIISPNNFSTTNHINSNMNESFYTETDRIKLHNIHDEIDEQINFFLPGDLGFIDPHTNQLYIWGRTDDFIKVNGIRFHAYDIDNLLHYLKEQWKNQSKETQSIEQIRLKDITNSITLAIKNIHGKDLKLVCFYVIEKSDPDFKSQIRNSTRQYELPTQKDFITVFGNYIPICLMPTFINIDHIPLMRTTGKVDKEYLRQYYYSKYYDPIENLSKPIQTILHKTEKEISETKIKSCDLNKIEQNNLKTIKERQLLEHRDHARRILAEVLGIRGSNGDVIPGRPRDEEDFFVLGGDSLLSVLATEQLRQSGFQTDLQLFTKSGKIGFILGNLQYAKSDRSKINKPHLMNTWIHDGDSDDKKRWNNQPIDHDTIRQFYTAPITEEIGGEIMCRGSKPKFNVYIQEWTNQNDQLTTRDEIVSLIVNSFLEKDCLSQALHLDSNDLQYAVQTFLHSHFLSPGIILTARFKSQIEYNFIQDRLVGVLIGIPAKSVPSLNKTSKLCIIQRYFDACTSYNMPDDICFDSLLCVLMVGICSFPPYETILTASEWRKIKLRLLTQMEQDLLKLAHSRGFTGITTLNTNEVTREVCRELGYTNFKTTSLKTFIQKENLNILLSPQHENVSCSYMYVKLI